MPNVAGFSSGNYDVFIDDAGPRARDVLRSVRLVTSAERFAKVAAALAAGESYRVVSGGTRDEAEHAVGVLEGYGARVRLVPSRGGISG